MFATLCFVLVLITKTFSNDEISSPELNALLELMTRIEETCGKLQWCTVQAGNYTDEAENECCHRCYCDQDCFRTHSCCPDISLSKLLNGSVFDTVQNSLFALRNLTIIERVNDTIYDRSILTTENIKAVECISSSLLGFDAIRIWQKRPSYQMVSKCTNETISPSIKTLCESPEFNPGNPRIADFVPVQSWSTGLVYRNRYCALCNSIENDAWTEWDTYIATMIHYVEFYGNHFSSINDMMKFLFRMAAPSDGPVVYFEPNEELHKTHPPNVCHSFDVESCSTDKATNQSTIDACHNYVLPIYRKEDGNLIVYKNLACLLCNDNDLTEQNTCRMYDVWEKVKPFTGRIQNAIIKSEDKLQSGAKQIQKLNLKFSPNCEAGHIYDSHLVSEKAIWKKVQSNFDGSSTVGSKPRLARAETKVPERQK